MAVPRHRTMARRMPNVTAGMGVTIIYWDFLYTLGFIANFLTEIHTLISELNTGPMTVSVQEKESFEVHTKNNAGKDENKILGV